MPRKRHKPEEIVAKLRRVDVLVSQGQSVAPAALQTAIHGRLRSARGPSRRPGMMYGLPAMRGRSARTAKAGALR